MSSYYLTVVNKETGELSHAQAIDDYFGPHRYGYKLGETVFTDESFWDKYAEVPPDPTTTPFKVGDRVDRANGSYSFPGTIVSLFANTDSVEYAVVEMDTYKLLHIFRLTMLKKI